MQGKLPTVFPTQGLEHDRSFARNAPEAVACRGTFVSLVTAATSAQAHVKWSAPYTVGAPPEPAMSTIANIWLWVGIVLVFVFFGLMRAIL